MASSLKDRLKRIRESAAVQGQARAPRAHAGPGEEGSGERDGNLPGWTRISPCLHYRSRSCPISFPERVNLAPFLLRRLSARPDSALDDPVFALREDFSFIDLETTGLSTGAGTLAFAFGHGAFNGTDFILEQWFMSDLRGEEGLLDAVETRLPSGRIMVSYNGKSFDSSILRSRFILSRRRPPQTAHVDLLVTARRLWSSIAGGASLALMEERILGTGRHNDIDGSEAPQRYQDWLTGAPFERIQPILEHHALDILALPALMERAASTFERCLAPFDARKLALLLKALGRPGWEEHLRAAASGGDGRACAELAFILSREGRKDEALPLWLSLGDSHLALREAAKILEHHEKDYMHALALAERGASLGMDFKKRIQRLRRKMN